jgi:hypothetical protein
MKELIRKTLDHCGYTQEDATEENLEMCFLDYVDSGAFGNVDVDEAEELIRDGEITLKQICYNLLKR